jgi:hypothetical protein
MASPKPGIGTITVILNPDRQKIASRTLQAAYNASTTLSSLLLPEFRPTAFSKRDY